MNKFTKILLLLITIAILLASITYFVRTVIDIGCAKTLNPEEGRRRDFATVRCWYWERTFQLQQNL